MNYADPEQRDRLAAEYALGTMRGAARQRFERLLSGNADLRDLAHDWELRVNLLAEAAPAVEPPAHVWEGIAQRIGPASAPAPVQESRHNRLWDSLGFWRGAAALATAAAAALAFYVALQPSGLAPAQIAALDQRLTGIETKLAAVDATPREIGALEKRLARIEDATQGLAGTASEIAAVRDRLVGLANRLNAVAPAPTHVGVLLDKDQRPMMTADLDLAYRRLVLRLNLTPPRDFTAKVLEVWMVPPGGPPRSLGLFPSEKSGTATSFVLSHEVAEALVNGRLAVSLEPSGGSTTGQPSGPGAVLRPDHGCQSLSRLLPPGAFADVRFAPDSGESCYDPASKGGANCRPDCEAHHGHRRAVVQRDGGVGAGPVDERGSRHTGRDPRRLRQPLRKARPHAAGRFTTDGREFSIRPT